MPRPRSIMTKMALLFIISAIPLYAVGLALYATSGQQLRREILDTKRSQMAFYLQSVEDELTHLSSRVSTMVNDPSIGSLVNRYGYFSLYEWGRRVNALRDDLWNVSLSSNYVDTVTVYMKPIGLKLNDRTGLDRLSDGDEILVRRLASDTRHIISLSEGELYAAVCVKDSANAPVWMLAARLSLARIEDELKGMASSVPTQSVMVYEDATILAEAGGEAHNVWDMAGEAWKAPEGGAWSSMTIEGEKYLVTAIRSPFMHTSLNCFVRERDLTAVSSRYIPWLLSLTAAGLVLIVLLLNGSSALVHRPLKKLIAAFHAIREGDLKVRIEHHRLDEFSDVYDSFNQTTAMLDDYVERSLKQELMLRRSEILQLQAQINPHFLYNSYFMLHRMVKKRDWENAERFSGYMGQYFQYITRNAAQVVPLEAEAAHARIYAEIQLMRFSPRISVDFGEVPAPLRALPTPRLILQPVLENAFEHGMRDVIENGLVRVRFLDEGGRCVIIVEDNGQTLSEEALERLIRSMDEPGGEETALKNICHRLRLRSADGLSFALTRSPLGGLRVEMTLYDEVKQE